VEFALSRGGRVLLGDEMGLGKTAQDGAGPGLGKNSHGYGSIATAGWW